MDPATLAPAAIIQVVAVWLIQRLKCSPRFRWLSPNTPIANRIVAFLVAFLSATGITYQWASNGDLVIHGLMMSVIIQHVWTWLSGVVTNELAYMLVQIHSSVASGQVNLLPTPAAAIAPTKKTIAAQPASSATEGETGEGG